LSVENIPTYVESENDGVLTRPTFPTHTQMNLAHTFTTELFVIH